MTTDARIWTPERLARSSPPTPAGGLRLDTSDLTVDESVEAILARFAD